MIFGSSHGGAGNELDVSLERLSVIIHLARMHEADLLAVDASDSRDDAGGGASTPEQDPSERDLRAAIAALPADEQAVLVALVWIGRGDFAPQEFDEALTRSFDRKGSSIPDYLLGLPALADTLVKGTTACGADFNAYESGRHGRSGETLH